MRAISTAGLEKPRSISAGAEPILRWLSIADLIVDPCYHPQIGDTGRRNVERIARAFTWSCFTPVVVAAVEGGKYAIIDGQRRTTAAAVVGFDTVPCQVVTATREEQALAFKSINGAPIPVSRMALYGAALAKCESWAMRVADVCARANVDVLRYPVPIKRQAAGQTMAVGAITQCLNIYSEETVITALQCVTQTVNNKPGALSARIIKALCAVLDGDRARRDSGLTLLEAFDGIDLLELQSASLVDASIKKINPTQALARRIHSELGRLLPRRAIAATAPRRIISAASGAHCLRIKFLADRTQAHET